VFKQYIINPDDMKRAMGKIFSHTGMTDWRVLPIHIGTGN